MRPGGAKSATALKLAISPPAKPNPIRARAIIKTPSLVADPKSAAPAAATSSNEPWTRRGPNRSSNTPNGAWKAAKAIR